MQPTATPNLQSEQPAATVEAAVLFSAGHDAGALRVLEEELARAAGGDKTKAWAMLLEIHQVRADRAGFESVAGRYAAASGCGAPDWPAHEHRESVPGMLPLEGVIGSRKDLAGLIEYARTRRMIGIDMGRVERIRFDFAPELCALLRTYANQGKRIILGNICEVHAQLLELFGGVSEIVLLRPRPSTQARPALLEAA